MPPDEPNDEERQEEQAEDTQTPFSPPDPQVDDEVGDEELVVTQQLDDTHPATDTGIQPEGIYQDGLADEAGTSEPNANNQVEDYDPEADEDPKEGVS